MILVDMSGLKMYLLEIKVTKCEDKETGITFFPYIHITNRRKEI